MKSNNIRGFFGASNVKFNQATIIVGLVLLALFILLAPASRAQKLKNAVGTLTTSGTTYSIDSIIYDSGNDDLYVLYFTQAGVAEFNTVDGRALAGLGKTGNFFGDTLKTVDNGGGKVTCYYSSGGTTATFSYSRWTVQLKLGTGSVSDTCQGAFISSVIPPPAHFFYHFWVDSSLNDSLASATVGYTLYQTYVVTNAKGNQVDSENHFWPGDTTELCPGVPAVGSYVSRLNFIADSMVVISLNAGVSFYFIINPGLYQSQCKGLPWLSFDASYGTVPDTVQFPPPQQGKGWQGGGGIGKIQDSGTIYINNILRFNGVMILDTVNSLIDANGEYYVYTVLPFGIYSGPWKLGNANWPKFTYSCNGLVPLVPIINDAIRSDSIAGFTFRIDSIFFITDSTGLSGLRLGATMKINNVTSGGRCTDVPGGKSSTDLVISPIEITTSGIGGAIRVKNVSIYPGFCVKELLGSYYSKPDSLNFAAKFQTPFIDTVGMSAGWVHGVWDALGFQVQASAPNGIPLANTTMQLTGIRGSASGWNNPPLKVSMGGTFDDALPNTMRWAGDLSYKEPSTLTGSLTLSFLNIPGIGWQLVSNATAEVDWNHYVKFSGSTQAGTFSTKGTGLGYIFNGSQSLTFTWNPVFDLIGTLNGSIQIPKLFPVGTSAVTDYINSLLPIQLASAEMLLKSGVFRGNISLSYIPFVNLSAHLGVNLNLPYTDPNFINFGLGTIPLNLAHPAGKYQITSLPLDSIHVPASTAFAVIRIRSNGKPSASTILDPSGHAHTNVSTDSLAQYRTDTSTNHGFWVLRSPAAGVWALSMPSRTATDTIDAEAEPMEAPLQFTASQVGKHVTLQWTPLSIGDTANVTAYLDDSSSGYTGFLYAIANDQAGTLSFDLNDSLPACQYYLYAARDNGAYISQSYSSLQLDNSKTSAFPPTNPMIQHLGGDTILLSWTPTPSTVPYAYAIKVTDANGVDSIYGSVDISADSAVIVIQNPQGQHISLDAYGDGIQSCWSPPISASSSVTPTTQEPVMPTIALQVWPNPTTGKGEISFTLSDRSMVRVTIFNVLGQELTSPIQGTFDAGTHTGSFDLSSLPPGTYYCRIQSEGMVETVKLAIEH